MYGLEKNSLIVGLALLVVAMFFSSNEDRFCWSLFLIPNIRLFDELGLGFIVNILICLPFVFYFLKKILWRSSNFSGIPIMLAILLFMMECIHIPGTRNTFAPLIGWTLGFVWCCYVTLDDEINVNKSDIIYALSLGIIVSAVVYFVNNSWFAEDIINKIRIGHRFQAYASDPNYYSLYICLSLAAFTIKEKIKLFDYILMIILAGFGLMTASKMCILLMSVILIYLLVGASGATNKFLRSIVIILFGCCIVYAFWDYIEELLGILLKRTGGKNMNANTLTTGRIRLVTEYLNLLKDDASTLMFGRGFSYRIYLFTSDMKGSHNTFLDFILSWGVLGTVVLIFVISIWFKKYKKRLGITKFTKTSKFPFLILVLAFCSLSCFSAGMFFFVITFCLLQLKPVTENNDAADVQDMEEF